MTAAIYAARAGYSATIIEKIATGGQMILTDTIENYPGFSEGISGFELQQRMEDQATRFGAKIVYDDVSSLRHSEGLWHIAAGQNYTAKTVIIATGFEIRVVHEIVLDRNPAPRKMAANLMAVSRADVADRSIFTVKRNFRRVKCASALF